MKLKKFPRFRVRTLLVLVSVTALILALNTNGRRGQPFASKSTNSKTGAVTPLVITQTNWGWPLTHVQEQTIFAAGNLKRSEFHWFDGNLVGNLSCWAILVVGLIGGEYALAAMGVKRPPAESHVAHASE